MIDDNLYRYKYLKYKKKFWDLKKSSDQLGGHGTPTIKLNTEQEDYDKNFIEHNRVLKQFIVLDTKNSGNIDEISYEYKKVLLGMLENLMTPVNGKINLDFLNDFNRNIHVDLAGDYSIKENNFVKNNLNYEIDKTISQGTGGGDIFLLKRKNTNNNLPNELILKIFNTSIDINKIKNYTSLEITRITNDNTNGMFDVITRQQNYIVITKNEYTRYYNFNDDYIFVDDFMNTNNSTKFADINEKIHISTKNDNFINEILINLTIEKILFGINNDAYDHYIKYYNYFIANINGVYRGCVIMEKMDGSLDRLFNEINRLFHEDSEKNNILNALYDSVVKQIVPSLLALKTKEHQFTHTDMKAENVFFKEIDLSSTTSSNNNSDFTINTDGRTITYKFYVADFDKSSITYNGVRFYNDYTSSHSVFTKVVFDPQSFYTRYMDFAQDPNSYGIFRTLEGIPTEVFAMRYIMFPFFLFFDLQSLCFSLFSHEAPYYDIIEGTEYYKLLSLIFGDGLSNIRNIYRSYNIPYAGDFSKLMNPLVVNPNIRILKPKMKDLFSAYSIDEIVSPHKVNTVIISKTEHKLIISIPFIQVDRHTASYFLSQSVIYVPNNTATKELYNFVKDKYTGLINFIFNERNKEPFYVVNFTGNIAISTASSFNPFSYSRPGAPIVITNRYTSKKSLYEFDWVNPADVKVVFDVYKDIFSKSFGTQ
ncbi:putative serine/threonine-protein kinase [Tupanvirus soda lake]|uniref:Serine/threonine-protein kinase n=2 Tax=Tupanvirus TaxID=2094720 RepID=A0AC62ADJ3_9VIRU|nr:putative serine/threonine-protein kinase [Tupanvirus soda lake]QKU35698.1 putative serine/threonine-protein kinase [Tupanvirus soda lake]